MVTSRRRSVADWDPYSLLWSTQFNDQRNPETLGKKARDQYDRLKFELKMKALLLPGSLIRDADFLNNRYLLYMLWKNDEGIHDALKNGSIVLGIRESAESLTEVNEGMGMKRKDPKRYDDAKRCLPSIERDLRSQGVDLAGVPMAGGRFEGNLQTILSSDRLFDSEKQLLREGIDIGRAGVTAGGSLRYGSFYPFLIEKGCDPYGDLLQLCRTAHTLAEAPGIGLSTADRDLRPDMVALFRSRKRAELGDPGKWFDWYPKRILPANQLMHVPFSEIEKWKVEGERLGYFKAARAVQRAIQQNVDPSSLKGIQEMYLRSLAEYLEKMGTDGPFELVEWQKRYLQEFVRSDERKAKALCWSVPVLLAAGVSAGSYLLESLSLVPPGLTSDIAPPAWAGAAATVPGLLALRALRPPSALSKLLAGTTVTPNS